MRLLKWTAALTIFVAMATSLATAQTAAPSPSTTGRQFLPDSSSHPVSEFRPSVISASRQSTSIRQACRGCAQGVRGPSGFAGPSGPPGRCPAHPCHPSQAGPEGPVGDPGLRGLAGGVVEVNEGVVQEALGNLTEESGRFNEAGVLSVPRLASLRDFSHTLPEGTVAFAASERLLMMKVNDGENQWILLNSLATETSVRLPFTSQPQTTSDPSSVHRARTPGSAKSRVPAAIAGQMLRLVPLPFKLSGSLSYRNSFGLIGADYACQVAAEEAGLVGAKFRAFVSDRTSQLERIVHRTQRNGVPVTNFRGQRLFNSFDDLLTSANWPVHAVDLVDFKGRRIRDWPENRGAPHILAWQGPRRTEGTGKLDGPNCRDFTSRSADRVGLVTDLSAGRLLQSLPVACDTENVVLCLEAHDARAKIENPVDY